MSACSEKEKKEIVSEVQQPNIIYIMSDDHCAQAIGAYEMRLASLNPTPTIDQLAKEGMLFENAFCTLVHLL